MNVKYLVASLAIGLSASVFASPELPRHADLDLKTARLLADTAMSSCTGTVSVLDRGGNLLVTLRGDGVGPHGSDPGRTHVCGGPFGKTRILLAADRPRARSSKL